MPIGIVELSVDEIEFISGGAKDPDAISQIWVGIKHACRDFFQGLADGWNAV